MRQRQTPPSRRPRKSTAVQRRSRWFDIPRFLDRKVVQEVMEERGVTLSEAAQLLFNEDNGTPMPRIRRRTKA